MTNLIRFNWKIKVWILIKNQYLLICKIEQSNYSLIINKKDENINLLHDILFILIIENELFL